MQVQGQVEQRARVDAPRHPTRRAVARGLAWSVPVIAVGAPVPALAASAADGGVSALCGSRAQGTFTVDVTGSSSPYVQVVFSHSGSGSSTVSAPGSWILSSSSGSTTTYLVPVVSGTAGGTATVTFSLGQNGTGTVTASISATSGQAITGPTSASITKRRDGNSNNYACSTAG